MSLYPGDPAPGPRGRLPGGKRRKAKAPANKIRKRLDADPVVRASGSGSRRPVRSRPSR